MFGESYGDHYSSLSAMFVESAALYSLMSIPLLISYGLMHPISQIFLSLNPAAQVSSNLNFPSHLPVIDLAQRLSPIT